jgi:predicted phosphodiesterase
MPRLLYFVNELPKIRAVGNLAKTKKIIMPKQLINKMLKAILIALIWVSYGYAEEIRFAVIADHRNFSAGLENALEFIDSQDVDFIIVPGDFDPIEENYNDHYVAHGYTAGPEHQPDRQEVYFVIGNHDTPASGENYFQNNIAPYYPSNGPPSAPNGTIFSFDRGNSHFVVTNQYWEWNYSYGGYTAEQMNWLEQDLASSQKPFKFVIGHEPAFPQFRHVGVSLDADPQKRDEFWKILSENGVSAYVCGHTHYIYSDIVDGVYQLDAGAARDDSLNVIIVDVDSTAMTARLFSTAGDVPTADDEFEAIALASNEDEGEGSSSFCFISTAASGFQAPTVTLTLTFLSVIPLIILLNFRKSPVRL